MNQMKKHKGQKYWKMNYRKSQLQRERERKRERGRVREKREVVMKSFEKGNKL